MYRDSSLHPCLDYDRGGSAVNVSVPPVHIQRSTCFKLGPFRWGKVYWGETSYFVISTKWISVWL
jgi:hypothetical protein